MKENYYKILGIDKNASQDEIKKAFRKKAMEHHPDKNNGDDKEFKKINEAYSVLSDKKKRQNYDNFGSTDAGNYGGFSGQGAQGFDFSQASGFGDGGFDFDLGDIFGEMFGGGRNQERKKVGRDIQVELDITFKESVLGVKKTFKIKRDIKCQSCGGNGSEKGSSLKTCSTCEGTGRIVYTQNTPFGSIQRESVCDECKGKGKVPEKVCRQCNGSGVEFIEDEVNISIPAGIETGQKLRLVGRGYEVPDGINGDLYIYVNVAKSDKYERRGYDLYMRQDIKYSTAILGDKIDIDGIEKKISIKIPAGTKTGTKFKIKSEGVRGGHRGDLYVEVKIQIPEKVSSDFKKIIKELKKIGG